MTYDYRAHFGEVTLTQDLMSRRDERRWRLTPAPASGEHHDIVLYLGCNVLRTSHMVQTVTAIFDRLDLDYVAVGGPSYCCGIVHHTQGDVEAARGMSQGTIRLFERFSPREVVMWCPSCIYFYDEVQQLALPFPFRQAAEFLVEYLPALRFTREVSQRVALHYHVQNDSRRREGAAGRTLLEAVASSLTELFAPSIHRERISGMLESYDFVGERAMQYFRRRLDQANRDADFALAYVKEHARTPEQQQQVLAALEFKCSVLWAMCDALQHAYVDPGEIPPGAFAPGG